ncbi:hypothetical protein [Acinetobacter soli]|uniref:hypothetical protein n=1 Tax=Acinetobacter soli TaxID=487316 RepID=UPI003A8C3927
MIEINRYSCLVVEDFIEEVILDKKCLKNIVINGRLNLFWDFTAELIKSNKSFRLKDVDFNNTVYYYDIFLNFIEEIKKLFLIEKVAFERFSDKFKFKNEYFDSENIRILILTSDIHSLDNRYLNLLNLNNDQDFIRLKNKICKIYDELKLKFYSRKYEINFNQVVTGLNLGDAQKFDRKDIEKSGKKIVYLDTNVFSKILEDDDFKKKIIDSKVKYQYCYSAYLLEDKIKQNILFTEKVLNLITEVTDNFLVTLTGDYPGLKSKFCIEPPDIVLDRVKLWLYPTQAAENNKFNFKILESLLTYNLEKCSNLDVLQMIEYLKNPSKNLINFSNIYNFSEAFNANSLPFCRINDLLKTLDILEFKVDSKKQKIISSFQDNEHLKVAYNVDYFLTDDKKLLDRAKVVYSVVGCKVELYSTFDFIKKL